MSSCHFLKFHLELPSFLTSSWFQVHSLLTPLLYVLPSSHTELLTVYWWIQIFHSLACLFHFMVKRLHPSFYLPVLNAYTSYFAQCFQLTTVLSAYFTPTCAGSSVLQISLSIVCNVYSALGSVLSILHINLFDSMR